MMKINYELQPHDLTAKIESVWRLSGDKILAIEKNYDVSQGSPVFTVKGQYTTRGWTEWTQGFQYGSAILQYDATDDEQFLAIGRDNTIQRMAPHVSHIGVHDHGFNNVSTYGNLLRLMREGRLPTDSYEAPFYELALKISGAVQASRWTEIKEGGFIHSFNGSHSLFVDTIRSCRALVISHLLGHVLQGENDVRINLLGRALSHIKATADYSIFYGDGRDAYDVRGRTAHECIFNTADGNFRCPNSQQGFSGFTTWTRGLAWAMLGFAEELEMLDILADAELDAFGGRDDIAGRMRNAARAACDFYIDNTPT
ncbi:glycosyl hydrolase, partial [candidate division KSB1 bacterium]